MIKKSRISLFGLPIKIDIIRETYEYDEGGGVSPSNTEIIVYSQIKARISLLTEQDKRDNSEGVGFRDGRFRKVLVPASLKVEESDLIRIAWGDIPNAISPVGLADGFPPSVVLGTPAGDKTLNWNAEDSRYVDEDEKYIVEWVTDVWKFTDVDESFEYSFTGFRQTQNIFKRPWSDEVGEDYSVARQFGPTQDHRVVWKMDKIDDIGGVHHTSLIVEFEDKDT